MVPADTTILLSAGGRSGQEERMESVCNETSKISHDFAKIEHIEDQLGEDREEPLHTPQTCPDQATYADRKSPQPTTYSIALIFVSTDTPATLKHSTDSGRGNQLRISTNHLIDFILTELGQACTVTSTAIRRFVGQNRPKQGCHPLTLLVIALTAAPPSHHLRILTINVEFFSNCEKTVEFNAPFVKRLLSALPSDAPSDCLLIITAKVSDQPSILFPLSSLSACLSDSTSPSRNALSLLTTIEAEPARARTFLPLPCLAVMRKAQPETDLRKARRSRLRRGCWRSSSGILSTRSHKARDHTVRWDDTGTSCRQKWKSRCVHWRRNECGAGFGCVACAANRRSVSTDLRATEGKRYLTTLQKRETS
ncbi:hypothetical protein BLNAU_13511 [Blattamonas nauphoetae]|uniref:Uncharacterized protein n=1 Tax=Blattamonas nauphoetae TaxID=2049346 RepID=A0ABQ9XLX4_9EUKA|nr:hypothetical protein BLNAU_13511 [Blattamonas nauphoetae]